jgi:hypothetical protein
VWPFCTGYKFKNGDDTSLRISNGVVHEKIVGCIDSNRSTDFILRSPGEAGASAALSFAFWLRVRDVRF